MSGSCALHMHEIESVALSPLATLGAANDPG